MLDIIGSAFRPIRRLTCLFRGHKDGFTAPVFDGWVERGAVLQIERPERCIFMHGAKVGHMQRLVIRRKSCVRCGG